MTDMRFHHGGVSVPDLDAAIAWYGAMLGFDVECRFEVAAAGAKAVMVRKGDLRFELFEVEGAAPLPAERRVPTTDLKTHGNKHVAFSVADLEAHLSDMRRRGADIALVVRENLGSAFFIRDCAGNLIEFVQAPGDDTGPMP